jgi:hypothetical protein
VISPAEVSPAITNAWASMTDCVTSNRLRLGKRSTTAPLKSENTSMGRNRIMIMVPRAKGELVRLRISQAWATSCIQLPARDTVWP